MIKIADLLVAQSRGAASAASNGSQPGSSTSETVDNSASSVEANIKRTPELALSNGRYYLTKPKNSRQ